MTPSIDPFTENVCEGYEVTYRWVTRDNCGNELEISRSFNVLPDSEGPAFDSLPKPISDRDCGDPLPVIETLTVTDDCSNVVVTPNIDPYIEDNCNGYFITYRWSAFDGCGNLNEVTQTFFTRPDTIKPTFLNLPNAIADVNCGDNLPTPEAISATHKCSEVTIL